MKKAVCIKSETYYNMSPMIYNSSIKSPTEVSILQSKLYYVVDTSRADGIMFYNVYDFDTSEYIGLFSSEKFGPYELWIALERDKKIEEILND